MESSTRLLTSPFQIKHLQASGEFSGYASTYGIDQQRDQMMPGAFKYTLKHWKQQRKFPLLLWQHRLDEPIGFWTSMAEDQKGLHVKGQLIMDLQRARDTYVLMKNNVLGGLSIGFYPVLTRFDPQTHVRKIYQVNLTEVSVVTSPANTEARIEAFKARSIFSKNL